MHWPSHELSAGQAADLELLLLGALEPLDGYLTDAEARLAAAGHPLPDGRRVALGLQLEVPPALAADLQPGATLGLRDAEGVLLAGIEIRAVEASGHVAGRVFGLALPVHPDFRALRRSPDQVRDEVIARGWRRVAALVPAGPVLPGDLAAAHTAVPDADGILLITPCRPAHPHDESHFARSRLHRAAVAGRADVVHVLLPVPGVLGRPGAGDADVRLTGAVAAACGATVILTSAPMGADTIGNTAIEVATVPEVGHDPATGRWVVGAGRRFDSFDLTRALESGGRIPDWAAPAELAAELHRDFPPRSLQGVTVLFTGLSGSGKSTIAGILDALLKERGDRHVTLLDGDVVRTHLSKGLGFSRADRDTNVRRIGFVAAQVTSAGGIAICAPIAPYDKTRHDVREMVEATGGFVLVHVATPLEVCEGRDRKGLYAKARQGLIPEFTGISDPYEEPADAEVTLDTRYMSAEEGARNVLEFLVREGWLSAAG